ncbi:MAG: ABC transporter ATP-binding protein [Candidatus Bathyarchaeota archaeon]|nr:ABC transporter ATP-binding protein [Candidatus Bathyarchaeota archaeon]
MSVPLIEASELTKKFGSVQALTGLNFRVMPGEIYGLLGPNGAGKTTTIKVITGLLEPTSGWVKVGGFDPAKNPIEVKSRIGYVAETPILYESLSSRDFLEFVASIRKIDQNTVNRIITQLADAFNMAKYFDAPIATLSMGMKQKVALLASIIHQPPILLLDEPLNGLDAKSSRIIKELLSLHAKKGGAILFSTHIMEVAEHICTRIGIIYQGKVIAEGTLDQLKSRTEGKSGTLEEVFLKLTNEEMEVADTTRLLGEAFFKNEAG